MITVSRASMIFYSALALVAGVAIGALFQMDNSLQNPQSPDWTVARCSLWIDNSNPVLPPYTVQNVCVEDNGAISVAPDQLVTK